VAVLGYCMVCQRLVPIRPVAQRWGSREREWAPFPHDDPDKPGMCVGTNKTIR
jgi:hypothetical protein